MDRSFQRTTGALEIMKGTISMANEQLRDPSYKRKYPVFRNWSALSHKLPENDNTGLNNIEKEELQREKSFYASFFQNNNEVMLFIDPKTGNIIDANRAACDYYGWPHEVITGKNMMDINVLPAEEIDDEIERAEDEKRKYLLLKHALANGQVRDVEVYSGLTGSGENELIYNIVHDIAEQELIHDRLKKKRLKLSAVQKLRNIGEWEIDLASGKVTVSEETKRICGIKSGVCTINRICEIPLPKYLPVLEKAQNDLVKRNIPFDVQFKIRRPNDGEIRVIHAVAEYHSERNTIIGVLHDITPLKQTKGELRERKTLLNEVGRIAHVGGWELDPVTNTITWTYEVARIHGLRTNRIIDLASLLNHYSSSSRKLLEDALKRTLKKGQRFDLELELITAKEKHRWIRMIGHPKIDDGRIIKVTGSIQDITEQKKAAIKISEEAAWRRALMEGSRDGIVAVDQEGNIIEANPRYAEMLGYSHEEIQTMNLGDMDIHCDCEEISKTLQHSNSESSLYETCQKRKDGSFVEMEINANTAVFGDRKMTFCVCRDIGQRKMFERELMAAKICAESANKTKSDFLSIMSHELRTPLTSIIGFSDVMLEGIAGSLNKKQTTYMTHVLDAGNHLLELINGILDLSKVESGESELFYEIFDVSQTFSIIIEGLYPLATRKDIHIEIEMNEEIKNISADRIKFKQILTNLLSNAIKFTPENGNVNIKVEILEDHLQTSIKDTGIGIAEEDMDKLFQPFKQLNPHLTRKHEGTGLGLALSKKFVEMHGGKIWVESKIDEGSVFTFTIPVRPRTGI
ncbi:PAS domain-containing sensor histidine kinase [Methanolobus sp. WCC4]|uniref:sensor histidine kinase n=1 Tax=Methanolobus sp. WCC4 TaxID=3125784 RepID=UPI0030FBD3F8